MYVVYMVLIIQGIMINYSLHSIYAFNLRLILAVYMLLITNNGL